MRKKVLAVLMAAAMATIPMGCGKEEGEEPAQAEENFNSLADWYTAKQIEFSEMEETLNETITGYEATIAVEGNLLIYRFTATDEMNLSDGTEMEREEAKMKAYCEENRELFAAFAKQVAEESDVETTQSHVEVMDASLENLIYLIPLEDIEG